MICNIGYGINVDDEGDIIPDVKECNNTKFCPGHCIFTFPGICPILQWGLSFTV